MNVDPTYFASASSPPVKIPGPNERNDLGMRNQAGLMDQLIGGQKLPAASVIAYEQFAIHQLMPGHFLAVQEPVEFGHVGGVPG